MKKVTVTIELKPSVLDPQGKAIQHSLGTLGFGGVEEVRVGKLFRITLNDDGATEQDLHDRIDEMCRRLLANTVIENYSFEIDE